MSMINYASREINCKLVYYGPGLGGKTTNLEHVYNKVAPASRGKMISLATETERTLFFDFLPVDLGNIRGFKVLDLESADVAAVDRQEVKEERPLGLGGERDHLSPGGGGHLVVDMLQIGGLATESGPIIHQFAVDLARGVVDHRHWAAFLKTRRVCRSRLPPRPETPTLPRARWYRRD